MNVDYTRDAEQEVFTAQITAVALVSGQNRYTWEEVTPSGATGAYQSMVGFRSGDSTRNPMVELNNQALAVPAYVRAHARGADDSGLLTFEFDGGAAVPGSGAGGGWTKTYARQTSEGIVALVGTYPNQVLGTGNKFFANLLVCAGAVGSPPSADEKLRFQAGVGGVDGVLDSNNFAREVQNTNLLSGLTREVWHNATVPSDYALGSFSMVADKSNGAQPVRFSFGATYAGGARVPRIFVGAAEGLSITTGGATFTAGLLTGGSITAGGTVTSITAGAGLTGGTITTAGTIALAVPVALASGGTGQTTAPAALNALLPAQSGHAGQFLKTDGSNPSWGAAPAASMLIVAQSVSFTAATVPTSYYCASAAATITATLPPAAGNAGLRLQFTKTSASSGTNLVTIKGNASEVINALPTAGNTVDLYYQYDGLLLECDGAAWNVVADYRRAHVCTAARGAAQSIPDATVTTIVLDTAVVDGLGLLSGGGVSIKRAGRYALSAYWLMQGTNVQLYIVKSGPVTLLRHLNTSTASSALIPNTPVAVVTLAAGDTLFLQGYQGGLTAPQNTRTGMDQPLLSVQEVR